MMPVTNERAASAVNGCPAHRLAEARRADRGDPEFLQVDALPIGAAPPLRLQNVFEPILQSSVQDI